MAMQALVMGFGGTGAHILTALKELTVLKHGRMPDSIKFLLFDTIADWEPGKAVQILGGAAEEKVAEGSEKATSLDKFTEYFYLSDHDPDLKKHVYTYLSRAGNPDNYPHLKDWLHAPWLSEHIQESRLSITDGAAQQRQIGRFAMFQNSDKIVERIGGLINSLAQHALSSTVNVWIIGSSAGGTGAGCLLDAAYMTRLAAGNTDLTLTGVIVLPDVYSGVVGISYARAYSLLRELDRVQEQGVPESDRYEGASGNISTLISSQVSYDSRHKYTSRIRARLFDDLFYLGKNCSSEDLRRSFFTSVANAVDPYLDTNSGPVLLQASVNQTAAASSFGAARLYVPVETFAEIFAWEQVEEYLKGAAAPSERGDRVINLYSGSANDRRMNGENKVKNMLALFDEILQRADWAPDQKEKWARSDALDSEKIITGWYQFAGAAIASERLSPAESQVVLLTYVNPFKSLIQTDEAKIPPSDLEVKSYKENKEVKGVKETQEDSRDRVANKLEQSIAQYTSAGGGERTFEKGRRLVYEKVASRLRNRVDSLIIDELKQNVAFAWDANDPEQGTPLTRLFEEIRFILSDNGPLKKIDATISKFLDTLNSEEGKRTQQPVDALHDLRTSKKVGFNPLSVWVEGYQQSAREECAQYIRWYQKRALLRDMQQIVRNVIERFAMWERTIGKVIDGLVFREGDSALFYVRRKHLSQLSDRLYRAARNPSALISFDSNPDTEMQGYRDKLRESVRVGENMTLAGLALSNSRWEASVAADGTPELHLIINQGNVTTYNPETIRNLHQDLHDRFHSEIDIALENTDVFDYLLFMRQRHNIEPEQIAKLLNNAATPLINAGGAPEECKLIYKEPSGKEKKDLISLIQSSLERMNASTKDPERSHSDPNSITLLKIKKPNMDQIVDLEDCRNDYDRWQIEQVNGDTKHDNDLYRAQVYHPFRQELEAWFIERRHWSSQGHYPADNHLPSRIVRLLEHPDMMHAFVQCIATGAIEQVSGEWIWHAPNRNVKLSDYEQDSSADVIRAAIVFTLQQREVGRSIQAITLADARKSAVTSAQKQNRTLDEMLKEFKTSKLDSFLEANSPGGALSREGQALKIVFEFYADPMTRTAIHHRMKL